MDLIRATPGLLQLTLLWVKKRAWAAAQHIGYDASLVSSLLKVLVPN